MKHFKAVTLIHIPTKHGYFKLVYLSAEVDIWNLEKIRTLHYFVECNQTWDLLIDPTNGQSPLLSARQVSFENKNNKNNNNNNRLPYVVQVFRVKGVLVIIRLGISPVSGRFI